MSSLRLSRYSRHGFRSFSPIGKQPFGVYTDATSSMAIEKEAAGLRIIELHLVPDTNGWVRLPPALLQELGIQAGDLLSFYKDESGFRVKGSKKPANVHYSSETPPNLPPETPTSLQSEPAPAPARPVQSPALIQKQLFEAPQPLKRSSRRRLRS